MQTDVSTNLRLPLDDWKAIKVKAAQEGKSMKELMLEGIRIVLGREKESSPASSSSLTNLVLDAMSFAVMKKEKLTQAIAFDDDFIKAGFQSLP